MAFTFQRGDFFNGKNWVNFELNDSLKRMQHRLCSFSADICKLVRLSIIIILGNKIDEVTKNHIAVQYPITGV